LKNRRKMPRWAAESRTVRALADLGKRNFCGLPVAGGTRQTADSRILIRRLAALLAVAD
jgi:hypothetical protein